MKVTKDGETVTAMFSGGKIRAGDVHWIYRKSAQKPCYRKYLLFLNCDGHVSLLKLVLLAEVLSLAQKNVLKL